MYEHRRGRLLRLIEENYGGVRKAVCDASGWSEARISQLLSPTYRDGRAFSEKNARKLEADLGLGSMYFDQLRLEGDSASSAYQLLIVDEAHPTFVQIPMVEMRLQAGIPGFQPDMEYGEGAKLSLPLVWVERKRLNPNSLVGMKVRGDSMYPSLSEGDTVIVDTSDKKMVDGAVFAVNHEGKALIKRLERDGGSWYLASDNPMPEFKRRMVRDNETIIVGRVVRKESDRI